MARSEGDHASIRVSGRSSSTQEAAGDAVDLLVYARNLGAKEVDGACLVGHGEKSAQNWGE